MFDKRKIIDDVVMYFADIMYHVEKITDLVNKRRTIYKEIPRVVAWYFKQIPARFGASRGPRHSTGERSCRRARLES